MFIGRTGAGKSTWCANDVGPESDQSVSETKFIETRTVNMEQIANIVSKSRYSWDR